MSSSPFRGGMPKNYDSGGSSSETEHVICLTMMEKKLRSTASKTKNKVSMTTGTYANLIFSNMILFSSSFSLGNKGGPSGVGKQKATTI